MVWRTCLRQGNIFLQKCSIFPWMQPFGPNSAHMQPHFVLTYHHRTLLSHVYVYRRSFQKSECLAQTMVKWTCQSHMDSAQARYKSQPLCAFQPQKSHSCKEQLTEKKWTMSARTQTSMRQKQVKIDTDCTNVMEIFDENGTMIDIPKTSCHVVMDHHACPQKPPWHGNTWTTMHEIWITSCLQLAMRQHEPQC